MTGLGWDSDGWRDPAKLSQISGERWGMTKTSLLGQMRFDERIPGWEGILWMRITHAAGRRCYLHKPQRGYHTEGDDRFTCARRTKWQELEIHRCIGEDDDYLRGLKDINPQKYARVTRKVRQGRLLSAFARRKGSQDS